MIEFHKVHEREVGSAETRVRRSDDKNVIHHLLEIDSSQSMPKLIAK